MLYLFTWNSDYLVNQQVKAWKKLFIEKHWDFNLIHIKDITQTNNNTIIDALLGMTFMNAKKLVIIDNIPTSSKNKDSEISSKQNFLFNILEKIPEENIILFSSVNPDKRSKIYKTLKKLSTLKEFNIKQDYDIINILNQKYTWKIDNLAINTIIKYKASNLDKIVNELEKLLITKQKITKQDIEENVTPELEESIFILLDDLLNLKISEALQKLNTILESSNIYAFYNNLLANIRTQVFIMKLKSISNNKTEITNSLKLWNRWFLVDKNYKINLKKLLKFYTETINLDKKMKTWKMIWTKDEDFRFELEKVILSLVKPLS